MDRRHDRRPQAGQGLEPALQRVMGSLGAGLRSPLWGPISGSLAIAAEHDPELAKVYRDYVLSRRERVVAVLREAQQHGELAHSIDLDRAVSLLAGPLYYHRLVPHQPLDEHEVTEHVRRTLALLLATDSGKAASPARS